MKRVYSAKFLTFAYFSVVAFALIAIHVSVYWHTTEELEQLYGQNRLDKVKEQAEQMLAGTDIGERASMRVRPQENTEFDGGTEVVFDFSILPDWLPNPDNLPWDEGVEAVSQSTGEAYYLMKTRFETGSGVRDAVLLMDFRLYEISEEQLFASHAKQVVISGLLLIISLFIVIKISARLTDPISQFATSLANKPAENLEPLPLPQGVVTRELAELVDTFNRYEERIRSLLERERSFSRYASHELRTPVTIIKGAVGLLKKKISDENDPAYRPLKRIERAVTNMENIIETLLWLSREDEALDQSQVLAIGPIVRETIEQNRYLLADKPIEIELFPENDPQLPIPTPIFQIMLTNLIRNAIQHTASGKISITIETDRVSVLDTGVGMESDDLKPFTQLDLHGNRYQGFGLGLSIVKRLCDRLGWRLKIESEKGRGTKAQLIFS